LARKTAIPIEKKITKKKINGGEWTTVVGGERLPPIQKQQMMAELEKTLSVARHDHANRREEEDKGKN